MTAKGRKKKEEEMLKVSQSQRFFPRSDVARRRPEGSKEGKIGNVTSAAIRILSRRGKKKGQRLFPVLLREPLSHERQSREEKA